MPVYNGEKFIRKCIESILDQTNRNFELIISDNASTDLTSDICTEFLTKDSRIKFVKQKKNMGANWNYNFLLEKAVGEYFVWVAADTIILPEFLEKNINLLESEKKIVGCISKIKIDQTYLLLTIEHGGYDNFCFSYRELLRMPDCSVEHKRTNWGLVVFIFFFYPQGLWVCF